MSLRILLGTAVVLALVGGGVYFLSTDRMREAPLAPEVAETTPRLSTSPDVEAPTPEPSPSPVAEEAPEPPPRPILPELGVLRVDSDVTGAQVFLDRQFVGTTPVVLEDVSIGGHQLTVSAEGFDVFAETFDVEPGPRDVRVNFREVRLDAAIDVVHDHQFGSCEGRLVATVAGLRYETDNENDAFEVSLDALEQFEVDYLETNLAVRPGGGRTFNFTDPEGNADNLFVFHRDVAEARARLAAGDPPAPAE